jgi:transcriptional regulator with XRE-family HTH domain
MMSNGKETCAKRISRALSIRNMKQSDLCTLTGIPKSAISQYISGAFEPKQDRIFLIANALDVSEAWLMGYDVPMEKETQSPDKQELTEGERKWLELYRLLSDDAKKLLIEVALSFDKMSPDTQRFLLGAIRAEMNDQK